MCRSANRNIAAGFNRARRPLEPDAPEEAVRKLTTVLDVPVSAVAERIQRLHEELGISYFSLNKTAGTSWNTLEKLVAALR